MAAAGFMGEAVGTFNQALSSQPDNVACLINLGIANIYKKIGHKM